MKVISGIDSLRLRHDGRLTRAALAGMLLKDLNACQCMLYGQQEDQAVVLARLALRPGSLIHERFDARIDLLLEGEILRDDCVPLTYRFQGEHLTITGRCSMIPKVCGVDWYLGTGYSGRKGDTALLKFKIVVAEILTKME